MNGTNYSMFHFIYVSISRCLHSRGNEMIKLFDKSTENVRVVTSKDDVGNYTDVILMEVNYTNEDGNIACTTEVILTEIDLINMLDSLSDVEDAREG